MLAVALCGEMTAKDHFGHAANLNAAKRLHEFQNFSDIAKADIQK